MIIFLIFISFMILINGCERINDKIGLEDDNIVEEVTETVVQVETGIDVDLTPRSPE